MNPKIQTLQNQLIELHKFKYDKIQKVDPRIDSDKLFEGNFRPFFYEYKDKLRNGIAFDLLVRGINRISGGEGDPLGNKLMNLDCALANRYPTTAILVSENLNGPGCNNIKRISNKQKIYIYEITNYLKIQQRSYHFLCQLSRAPFK